MNVALNLIPTNTCSPQKVVKNLAPNIIGHGLIDNFGQNLVQHHFAALDEKRFLLSDAVQDLLVVTNIRVPTPVRMLNVLWLFVLDLCEPFQILCFFIHSA